MAQEGILNGLTNIKVFDLPVGAVAGGAVVAGVGDVLTGIVQGATQNKIPSWAVKGLTAFAVVKWGHKLVGKEAAQIGGLFLTYDAVQEAFNVRSSVSNIVGGLTGRIVRNSPPQFTGPAGAVSKVAAGAPSTTADYYRMAEGRR